MQCYTTRFAFILIILTIAISSASSKNYAYSFARFQATQMWARYSSSGEELAFIMPEQPAVTSIYRPQSFLRKLKDGRMYAAYGDETVYIVRSFDNRNPKDELDVFIKESPQYSHLAFEHDVTLLGFSGKQYRSKNSNTEDVVQFYLTKNHAYVFEVLSVDINKPAVNQFFSTISLNEKSQIRSTTKASNTNEALAHAAPSPSTSIANQDASQTPVYKISETTRKIIIATKPEAQYTEEARRNNVTGTIRIRAIFTASGKVEKITPLNALPFGLTEKAIEAAHNIKFIPAMKDGKLVSVYVVLEYNMDLY